MLTPVYRQPDMTGPPVVFHYMRDSDGSRTPISYRVGDGPWVTDEQAVIQATTALFERDAIYARAMQAIAPCLPLPDEDGREALATRRLDVGEVVVIGLSAIGLSEAGILQVGEAISVAVHAECGADLGSGRLSVLWAG